MNWIDLAGYTGAFLSAITFMPQVYKAWKSRSVGDLSVWMILIVVASTITWLVYAFALHSGAGNCCKCYCIGAFISTAVF